MISAQLSPRHRTLAIDLRKRLSCILNECLDFLFVFAACPVREYVAGFRKGIYAPRSDFQDRFFDVVGRKATCQDDLAFRKLDDPGIDIPVVGETGSADAVDAAVDRIQDQGIAERRLVHCLFDG